MKKYTLNETPVRTSINFAINDITLDLDIPKQSLKDLTFQNNDNIKIESTTKKDFTSKIGLSLEEYKETKISIVEDTNKPLIINCNVDKYQVNNIIINVSKDKKAQIIIKCTGTGFHSLKINTNLEEYSTLKLDIINLIDDTSSSLIAIENNVANRANLIDNFIDLGGKTRISNYHTNLQGYESSNKLNNIYLGTNDDIIDMNYYVKIDGIKANCNIDVQGAIDHHSKKSFKGTVDFISGCTDAIGEENENCVILSDTAQSKSLPMLLCGEESVTGAHGVSSGKIDSSKLFYLMSRGLDIQEAKKLIINANFTNILNELIDDSIKEEIISIINKKIES